MANRSSYNSKNRLAPAPDPMPKYENDVTKMYRIAKITIKPLRRGNMTEDYGEKHVVDIIAGARGERIYICDYWVSEGVPFSVPESQIDTIVSYI